MSKKMMKRSLALGALMAFVITGSAVAEAKVMNVVGSDLSYVSLGNRGVVTSTTSISSGAIQSYGDFAITAGTDIIVNVNSGTAVHTAIDSPGSQTMSFDFNGSFNITANGEAHGIVANANGSTIDIDGNGTGSLKVVAGENALSTSRREAYNGTKIKQNKISIHDVVDVYIESQGEDEASNDTDRGHAIYAHNPNSSVEINASNDVTIKAIAGKDAVLIKGGEDQVKNSKVSISAGNKVAITGQVENWQKSTVEISGKNVSMYSTDANINSIGGTVTVNAAEDINLTSEEDGIFTCAANVKLNATNIRVDANDWGMSITDSGNDVDLNAENITVIGDKGGVRALGRNSTVDLISSANTQIDGDIIAGDGTVVIKVDAGEDIVIDGNVNANKGQIFVEADNNVTINGNVESRSGEGSGHLPYVDIKSGEDIVVNGALVAYWAEGSKDGSRPEGLKLEGNNITVNAGDANVLYNGAGKTSFVANGNIVLNGKNGLVNEGGNINVVADNINITAEGFAIISYSGTTEITPTGSSNIVGDIFVDDLYSNATPVVNVDLGEGGSLTGAVVNEHTGKDSGVNLDLGTGSTWNVTGESNVSTLSGSGTIAVTNLETGVTVATNKTGDVTVVTSSDNLGSDTVASMETLSSLVACGEEGIADKLVFTAGKYYDDVTADVTDEGIVITKDKTINEANLNVSDAAALGMMSWRAEMNDMNKRMGELRNANGDLGVWVRMVRGEDEYNNVKTQYNQYQLGYDEKLSVDERWTVGMALSYTDGETTFAKGNGENTNKAISVYGSKLNADGTFVDLIAKYARLENEFNVTGGIGGGEYSTNGYSVSAEFGKRIQQGNGLWIEPQAELSYGKVSAVDYVTRNGVNVAQDGMESIVGRVGFSIGKDIEKGNVYARASYLYDFDGETSVNLDGREALEQDLGGGWWEVGVGANINLSKATYVYADVEKTFGGEVDTNWQWNLGVRYSF